MKKVLIVLPSYSKGGGAEKILSNILNNGDFSDYHIDIVEIERGTVGFEQLPSNARVIGCYNNEKYPNLIRVLLDQVAKRFPKLLRKYLVKEDNYDVEMMFEVMYPDIPFSNRNIKKIYWVHGSIEKFAEVPWRKERYRHYFDQATDIVTISNKTEQSILELYPEQKGKISKIYNGYKFDEILEKSRDQVTITIPEKAICSIGRIDGMKGSDRTLELMNALHQQGKKYHMYYIGSGKMEKELKNRASEYGLSEYIHFLGYQTNPYKYLKDMKCLVSMSKQEGFPGVYVEALSLGVPFVSTDVGGADELSQGGKFGKIMFDDADAIEKIVHYVEQNEKIDRLACAEFLKGLSLEKQVAEFRQMLEC